VRRTALRGRASLWRELSPSFSSLPSFRQFLLACKYPPDSYTWRVKSAVKSERRSAPRASSSRSARLLNVSSLGLSLETTAALEKDRIYDLILRLDDQRMPVAARVLRVHENGGTFRASFVFERLLESDRALLEQSLVREVAERMTVIIR
jgi:hypothetical protein